MKRFAARLFISVLALALVSGNVAASAQADDGKWPIYRTPYAPTVYELVDNVTPTPISDERWKTVYLKQEPLPTDTSFIKYSWSPTLYAVTRWPGGEGSWDWHLLTYNEKRRAGFPAGDDVPWVGGSTVYKWATSEEKFILAPDGRRHKISEAEWVAGGSQPVSVRQNEGFMKLSWAEDVFRMTDIATMTGYKVEWAEKTAEDNPTPQTIDGFPGETFSVDANGAITYAGPTMSRVITYSQWRAAGFRLSDSVTGPAQSVADGALVGVFGSGYRIQSPATDYSIKIGSNYARFEVRAGDKWRPSDSLERAEVLRVGRYPIGDTYYWGAFDFRLTGDVSTMWRDGGITLHQIYQAPEQAESAGKPPALAFRVSREGDLKIVTRGDANSLTTEVPPGTTRASIPNVANGETVRIVYRVKIDPVNGSSLDVWANGQRVVRTTKIRLGYNDSEDESQPAFKFGQYRSLSKATTVAEFANVEFGTASLQSRVNSPLPWPTGY